MMQSCRKSCGKCGKTSSTSAGSGSSSGSGGKRSSSSSGGGSSTAGGSKKTERPATAADILGAGAYSLYVGKIAGRGVPIHQGRYDLRGARQWCDSHQSTCAGFTVQVEKPTPVPTGVLSVTFRKQAASIADDVNHVSYVRGGGGGGSCEDEGGGSRAGCAEAQAFATSYSAAAPSSSSSSSEASAGSSGGGEGKAADTSTWHGKMVAGYYLRAAELISYQGSGKAQEVVDAVRAALLSGADRDQCYMLRASAYLQLENVDNSKRDLSAILRSDPEHKRAKALHRQLKK